MSPPDPGRSAPPPRLLVCAGESERILARLEAGWSEGATVALADPADAASLGALLGAARRAGQAPPPGAAVLVGSGGSTGGRRWCLQPLAHLEASARATAHWLEAQGLEPASCHHLNPLPVHHVSGLLPWVRARLWGGSHRQLPPVLLHRPAELAELPGPEGRPRLLSLVPTQLARLLPHAEAVDWLRRCAVIWVGGAALSAELAEHARALELPLAPCYGATETAAMVCALPPAQFLAQDPARAGCGLPLEDVELRLHPRSGAVQVRTARLSPGWFTAAGLEPLPRSAGGWWSSGDAGLLTPLGLVIRGRLDGAISSGGETVFPEQLEARLRLQAQQQGLPLAEVLLLGVEEPPWGQRLVALVRGRNPADWELLQHALPELTGGWRPAERPRRWLPCPELAPTAAGKWQRSRWQHWLGRHRTSDQKRDRRDDRSQFMSS
ncbi:MAG: AMP-binding protein [Prochlorococcaceae cyanobacterium]|jgi:O-succinylbenzoic acid--CoA ligase